jgi:hypothetical protein
MDQTTRIAEFRTAESVFGNSAVREIAARLLNVGAFGHAVSSGAPKLPPAVPCRIESTPGQLPTKENLRIPGKPINKAFVITPGFLSILFRPFVPIPDNCIAGQKTGREPCLSGGVDNPIAAVPARPS